MASPARARRCAIASSTSSVGAQPCPRIAMSSSSTMKHKRTTSASHSVSTVSVRVKRLGQLFNSLDPSPFWDRDLDKEAAEFVETEFRDKPRDRAWVLNVTTADVETYSEHEVQEAVKHYYQRSEESIRQQTRERYRVGRLAIALGV